MRILSLTNLYPTPYDENRATSNRQQFKEIAAMHAIRVIAPISWTDEWAARRQGKPPLSKNRESFCGGIRIHHPRYLFTPRFFRRWHGYFFCRSVRRSFERAVEEFRPDVVYACWAYPDGWAAVNLARRLGLPVVIKVVGSDILLADGGRLRRVAEAMRAADGIIAVSEDLAKRAVDLGASVDRVRVVYSGVNTKLFHPGDRKSARARLNLSSDATIILFVGNLVPVKGADLLIEACARLASMRFGFDCYLIGQGMLQCNLEQLAASVDSWVRIRFVGAIAHDKLPDWFRAADLLVIPSRSEGVPNVLLEASACGIRFVATQVGGIPEIARRLGEGRLVEPGNPAAMASAIRESLGDGSSSKAAGSVYSRSHANAAGEICDFLSEVISTYRQPESRPRGDARCMTDAEASSLPQETT